MAHSSQSSLDKAVAEARVLVEEGARYQHYKTQGIYTVLFVGLQEATEEPCIIYRDASGMVWVRNVEDWCVEVKNEAGETVPRFTKLSD